MSDMEELLFYELNRDEAISILKAVRLDGKSFLIYEDEESDPVAVLTPWSSTKYPLSYPLCDSRSPGVRNEKCQLEDGHAGWHCVPSGLSWT